VTSPTTLVRSVASDVRATLALAADRRSRERLRADLVRSYLTHLPAPLTRVVNGLLGTSPREVTLGAPYNRPLAYRPGSSDLRVMKQVLVANEYAAGPVDPSKVEYIVDLGSNIGVTALLWASRYPNARIACVEPDAENFELLRRNTAFLGDRCRLLRTAVSDADGEVTFYRSTSVFFWSSSIRRDIASGDVATVKVPCATLGTVFRQTGFPRVDLLKMDIEGAEEQVLGAASRWGFTPRYMVAELHDPYTYERFAADCARAGLHGLPATDGLKLPWGVREAVGSAAAA
jgi:FkbM family methyltransferase